MKVTWFDQTRRGKLRCCILAILLTSSCVSIQSRLGSRWTVLSLSLSTWRQTGQFPWVFPYMTARNFPPSTPIFQRNVPPAGRSDQASQTPSRIFKHPELKGLFPSISMPRKTLDLLVIPWVRGAQLRECVTSVMGQQMWCQGSSSNSYCHLPPLPNSEPHVAG